jgi:hypothetical protein
MNAVLLLLLHGDDPAMELLYFWAAVLLALTPVIIFGGIGVWLGRKMWKERHQAPQVGTGNGERGTEAQASVPRSDLPVPH